MDKLITLYLLLAAVKIRFWQNGGQTHNSQKGQKVDKRITLRHICVYIYIYLYFFICVYTVLLKTQPPHFGGWNLLLPNFGGIRVLSGLASQTLSKWVSRTTRSWAPSASMAFPLHQGAFPRLRSGTQLQAQSGAYVSPVQAVLWQNGFFSGGIKWINKMVQTEPNSQFLADFFTGFCWFRFSWELQHFGGADVCRKPQNFAATRLSHLVCPF